MFLLTLFACGADPAPTAAPTAPTGDEAPSVGDALVIGLPFDPGSFNPILAPYALSGYFIENIALGLAARELGEGGLSYAPALAAAWAWSPDGLELRYTLREGLVWEDGTPLTAQDAAFTWSLIADPAVTSNWYNDAAALAAVEAPDPRTVVFRFHTPGNPALREGVGIRGLLPQHRLQSVDRAGLRGDAFNRAPTASGPWRVASWQPEERVVLEPNPRSAAWPRPYLTRVIGRVLPEYATRLLELRSGALDLLLGVELGDVPTLEADPRLRVLRLPVASVDYVGWNNGDPRLAAPEVRRALTMALDRDALLRDHYSVQGEPWGRPATGTVAPTLGAWCNTDLAPLPYDPAGARALLAQAGWSDRDQDGVLDRGAERLALTLLIQAGVPDSQRLATLLQAMLREVGVALEIQAAEPNRFSALARQHEFEAILWGFGANPRVDPYIQWHSEGQYNWMQYHDPETDALLERVRTATTVEEAQAAARAAQARIYEAQPATFLAWSDDAAAIDRRFRGVEITTLNGLEHLERWWVPVGERRY